MKLDVTLLLLLLLSTLRQEASVFHCRMAENHIYVRVCSMIFDTVWHCARTGCGLETDRV